MIYVKIMAATGMVYFDNIQLIKDTAQTYFYNSDGNLVKVVENSEQKTNLTYDSSDNLTSYTDALGYKTTLSYDSKHNVTKTVSPRNKATEHTYNSAGQVTSTTTSRTGGDNVTWKIQTKTAYTAADSASGIKAGAYVKSVTNQLDKVTSYNYNMLMEALKSVTRISKRRQGFHVTLDKYRKVDVTIYYITKLSILKYYFDISKIITIYQKFIELPSNKHDVFKHLLFCLDMVRNHRQSY